jgi:SAM-dependent methyltransferase
MLNLPPAQRCRLSGESLRDADVLFEVPDCPLAGVYPVEAADSVALRTPLRVVQARQSGLVQLGHALDPSPYQQYAFAGATSKAYTGYLRGFAQQVAGSFGADAAVLEVGCGDGTLLNCLQELGFSRLHGIDPGRPARQSSPALSICSGYFPGDLPARWQAEQLDLIIARHVIEHVETPRDFVAHFAGLLRAGGEVWLEAPDLDSTLGRRLWSNFYQLHCSYFTAGTLDALLGNAGYCCLGGELVEVFGGSLRRRYQRVEPIAQSVSSEEPRGINSALRRTRQPPPAPRVGSLAGQIAECRGKLSELVAQAPDPCAGYGAAERTAVTLGICPALADKLSGLYDGNPLLAGRYLAGTLLRIEPKQELFKHPPAAILLFAISHVKEILAEFRAGLPASTLVGICGHDFACQPLGDYR